jgi:hypothetical protein
MPDTGTSSSGRTGAKSGPWVTRKIGPLPVWAYGVIAVGAYYWYTHYGPGASKAAAAQQPAGGGLKTYAPRITETITERAPRGHRRPDEPEPKRKPPPKRKHHRPRPPSSRPPGPRAAAMAPAGPAGVNPGGPNRPPGPGVNPGGPRQGPPPRRKHKPPPPPPPGPPPAPAPAVPGPEQVASADYAPAGMQTGGAVNADTNQPVYWEWQHAHRGPEVPMPVQAYAPMTSGAVYDAASAGAGLAAG